MPIHGACNEVRWRPYPTNLPPPPHHRHQCGHVRDHLFCFSSRQLRYLEYAAPLTASAVGDRSLMWVCHITGTPGSRPRECQRPLTECSLHPQCKVQEKQTIEWLVLNSPSQAGPGAHVAHAVHAHASHAVQAVQNQETFEVQLSANFLVRSRTRWPILQKEKCPRWK